MQIHPSAIVHPTAQLGRDIVIGPFCIIEAHVEIGDRTTLESHVVIKCGTRIGADNRIFEGAVLGGLPQHARMPENPGGVEIGSGNTIREHSTVHRALAAENSTRIGDRNLLMVGAHVAHDCIVGNHTIFANGAMIAGHVEVEDRAYVSGLVAVHQFCRIGTMAMVGGHARVVKDVPPFVTVDGVSGFVVGLNTIGLRRNGFTAADMAQVKSAYRTIYRSGLKWREIVAQLEREFESGPAARFSDFLANSHRGIVQERRLPPGATIKLRDVEDSPSDEQQTLRAKAG